MNYLSCKFVDNFVLDAFRWWWNVQCACLGLFVKLWIHFCCLKHDFVIICKYLCDVENFTLFGIKYENIFPLIVCGDSEAKKVIEKELSSSGLKSYLPAM